MDLDIQYLGSSQHT